MALKPDDPCVGFHQDRVVAFLNEKIAQHGKGPEFYHENMSLSWEEVEDKLGAILEDRAVPSEAKEACAWGGLALGVRFARRQGQVQGRRVQWLHEFARLHRSASQALASDLKELTAQQELERKEAARRLRLTQASLAEARKERDQELGAPLEQATGWIRPATAGGAATEGEAEEEVKATMVAREPLLASEVAPSTTVAECAGVEAVGTAEGEEERTLGAGLMQLLGTVERKNYTSGGQREGEFRSVETAMFYFSGTLKPGSTESPAPLPVQLPDSFTYSYSCPLSPFSVAPTRTPPAATPPQMLTLWGGSDASLWSDMGAQGNDPQEHQRGRRNSEPYQQRRLPVVRRPGDWDCPWCKAVNFSRRETCFRCGRGIWLQNSQ
ncbi:testis-expressed protein 13B [Dasypus novemcinctus]|uniref:testis-expressed protein 13B n=1 Tax=Dasypus novemcinctus TaxID=9361 RepID=UPI00265EF946|nr:testis-expressed protein 13B [Dasypus novemcinctus]